VRGTTFRLWGIDAPESKQLCAAGLASRAGGEAETADDSDDRQTGAGEGDGLHALLPPRHSMNGDEFQHRSLE
jgi:hypothetical protein